MTKAALPPDEIPVPPTDVDAPPCTCITAPISPSFRVIVVLNPFCNGDADHKRRAVCEHEPVY